jgi:hypothetical protein
VAELNGQNEGAVVIKRDRVGSGGQRLRHHGSSGLFTSRTAWNSGSLEALIESIDAGM